MQPGVLNLEFGGEDPRADDSDADVADTLDKTLEDHGRAGHVLEMCEIRGGKARVGRQTKPRWLNAL